LGKIGREPDCFVVVRNCTLELMLLSEGAAAIVKGVRIFVIELNCLAIVPNGSQKIASARIGETTIVEGFSVRRIKSNSLIIVGNCASKVVLISIRFPTPVVRPDIIWIEVNRLVIVLDGPDQITCACTGDPAIVEGYRNVRIESDGLIVVRNRVIKILPCRVREARFKNAWLKVELSPIARS